MKTNQGMWKNWIIAIVVVVFARLLTISPVSANEPKGPVKVFVLAGQSNMDWQADIRTIDFLCEDRDPARAAVLKTFKPATMLKLLGLK